MKIKLSKSQWEKAGEISGWIKKASFNPADEFMANVAHGDPEAVAAAKLARKLTNGLFDNWDEKSKSSAITKIIRKYKVEPRGVTVAGSNALNKMAACLRHLIKVLNSKNARCNKSAQLFGQYVIAAQRPNGEVMYYCESATQEGKMVPNAQSIAYEFTTTAEAQAKINELQAKYNGLINWNVENKI